MKNRIVNPLKTDWRNPPQPLVEKFFHAISKESGEIEYRGQVEARLELGLYLVQIISLGTGENCHLKIVKLEDMQHWLFYVNNDHMEYSEQEGVAREGGKYRPAPKLPNVQF